MNSGLASRMLFASGGLTFVIAAAFAVLLSSAADLRGAQRRAGQSQEALVAAHQLERLAVDLETGQRGFLLTGLADLLEPWHTARRQIDDQAALLQELVADNPEQRRRAEQIMQACASYLRNYSVPLVDAARKDRAAVPVESATEEGKQRLDAIRANFDAFIAVEQDFAAARQRESDAAANRALVAAAGGLAGSVLLIAGFAAYLTRAIVQPVRRAAGMADRLARGDLEAQLPDTGVGEIGVLQRCFNTMARSLRHGRAELALSRSRIVAAADHARRRIERNLHDGTQQQLVALLLELRAAEAAVPATLPGLRAQLAGIADGLASAFEELREISRGIHPAILSEGGLIPALNALAGRATIPVQLNVDVPARLPEPIEVGAYYVASEALANTAKHGHATQAQIDVRVAGDRLHLTVRDDGVGGADASSGSGLIGLTDRVQVLDGTMSISSPTGGGTTLVVDLPSGRPAAGAPASGAPAAGAPASAAPATEPPDAGAPHSGAIV